MLGGSGCVLIPADEARPDQCDEADADQHADDAAADEIAAIAGWMRQQQDRRHNRRNDGGNDDANAITAIQVSHVGIIALAAPIRAPFRNRASGIQRISQSTAAYVARACAV